MRKMIPCVVVACLAAALVGRLLTGSKAVAAAEEGEAQFEDNFENLDAGWGEASGYGVEDGKFYIALEPQTWQTVLNQANVFKEMDATALVTIAKCDDPTDGAAGLVFWAEDYANYYAFVLSGDGRFAVLRHAAGNRLLSAVPWKASNAIKKGVGETNEIRIVTKEHMATLFVNGTEVATFKGQHPEGGGLVGFMSESWSKEPTRFEFAQLKVM